MKIYTAKNEQAKSSVEISLNHKELRTLISALTEFDNKIEEFENDNKDKNDLGFTHLHLKECNLIENNSDSDIVFYVNLNEK